MWLCWVEMKALHLDCDVKEIIVTLAPGNGRERERGGEGGGREREREEIVVVLINTPCFT